MKNRLGAILVILSGALLLAGAVYLMISATNLETQSQLPYPEIKRVSLKDAFTAYNQSTAIFLDVRDESSFKTSHIPGAINIPQSQLEDRLSELSPSKWIITYCT